MSGELERMLTEKAVRQSAEEQARAEAAAIAAQEKARLQAEQAVSGQRLIDEFVRLMRERSIPSAGAYYLEQRSPRFGERYYTLNPLGVRGWLVSHSSSHYMNTSKEDGPSRAILEDGRLVLATGGLPADRVSKKGYVRGDLALLRQEGSHVLIMEKSFKVLADWEVPEPRTFVDAIEHFEKTGCGAWKVGGGFP